jgi:Reverse transcriptase (RNA-dependent DNA polymerase)
MINDITLQVVFMLLVAVSWTGWIAYVLDINGAFLHGDFEPGEQGFMDVLKGFTKFYSGIIVLLLLKSLYGLKQAAYTFWQKLVAMFKALQNT